ncbi:DUF3261 domain-containing protein [Magnetospirillum sulfuroxidans]|uniref:DUF3261 domain-containing protein n=1 Tax=Magnetospirillum sulfuroxidans TaxID=611300 RepID=A0ABS5I6Z8_9PROT|nr:DUF3261 domain-containing protein [Magnetospirillum sulfuroxidans]MBR9970185.1 DUF3261 domain-containing protein [Magnetospirillum sulfuroxidans]
MIDVYDRPIMPRAFFPLMLVFLLAGCSAAPPPDDRSVERIVIAPGVTLRLPAAGQLGDAVEVAQMVTARHGGDSFSFEGRLSVQADHLILATTDGLGRRAMTVHWNEGRLSVEKASWLPGNVPPPANMLADIVLMYWPAEVLSAALDGAAIEEAGGIRRLRRDGAVVVEIYRDADPWNGAVALTNLAWDYHVQVGSTRLTP